MNKEDIILKTERYVEHCLKDKEPGHDYLHVLRVRKMALHLASSVVCDPFLVEILALLHDIEDHKFDDCNRVIDYLNSIDINDDYKKIIAYILPFMSFSKCPTLPESFPIEGKTHAVKCERAFGS